jgi:hypothetical protein
VDHQQRGGPEDDWKGSARMDESHGWILPETLASLSSVLAGWWGRLAWNRKRSRHEALIAMASRGEFLSHCGVFLSGENFHVQLSINLQLNRKSRLVSGGPRHWNELGKGMVSNVFCESCFPFFAYLLSQRCKKT